MAIVQTVSFEYFVESFRQLDRIDHFSMRGLRVLFDFIEDIAGDDNVELDVIELCCNYSEMQIEEVIDNYKIDLSGIDITDIDEVHHAVIDYLNDNACIVVDLGNTVLFEQF